MTEEDLAKLHSALCRVGQSTAAITFLTHDQAQRAVIEQQAKENKTLREALQLLYDCQNGCPLPKYETDWHRAMQLSEQVLKEVS